MVYQVGVYDGDLRSEITDDEFRWSRCFLPGEISPEELLISVGGAEEGRRVLTTELHVSDDNLRLALNHAAGQDHHEYLNQFACMVNTDVESVRRAFSRAWLSDGENLKVARNLIAELRDLIDRNT